MLLRAFFLLFFTSLCHYLHSNITPQSVWEKLRKCKHTWNAIISVFMEWGTFYFSQCDFANYHQCTATALHVCKCSHGFLALLNDGELQFNTHTGIAHWLGWLQAMIPRAHKSTSHWQCVNVLGWLWAVISHRHQQMAHWWCVNVLGWLWAVNSHRRKNTANWQCVNVLGWLWA